MWTTPRTAPRWTRSCRSWKCLLSDLAPQAGQVPMVSTVTGARCEGTALDGAYWCRNLRQTVRLDLALAELIGDRARRVCRSERAPGAGDAAVGGERRGAGVVVGSLRREAGGMSELLRNLGVLHCHGFAVDWEKVLGGRERTRLVALPTYAFQRQRYWLEAQTAIGDVSTAGLSSAEHPLLGSGDAVGGQRAVPADGAVVGDGAGLARRPCGVRDGAGAGDGAVGAGFCGGAGGGRDDGVAADAGGAAGAAGQTARCGCRCRWMRRRLARTAVAR